MGRSGGRVKDKKSLSGYKKALIILSILIIIFSVPGFSPAFCDWYTDSIYPFISDNVSRVTSLFPVALGELIMYLGIISVPMTIFILILFLIFRKNEKYIRFITVFFKVLSIAILTVVFIYLPTWFLPFRGTVLGMGKSELRTEYTYEEIEELLIYIVDGANAAAEEIEINDNGSIEFRTPEENHPLVAEAMNGLSDEYGRLSGYYPPVKNAICSDILNRMDIGGYNYPFTMEPTRNCYIDPLYQPILDAHELSHHKGYYKENEANFLSQIALSRSSDPYLRLAAFLNMYKYVYPEYMNTRYTLSEDVLSTHAEPELSDRVNRIKNESIRIREDRHNSKKHVIDELPTIDKMIHDTADTGWEVQGEILDVNSYDGVVLLLLQYYFKD